MITEQEAVKKVLVLPGVSADPVTRKKITEIVHEVFEEMDFKDLQDYMEGSTYVSQRAARRLDWRAVVNGQITRAEFDSRWPESMGNK